MATAFYRAKFEKQLTGSSMGGSNCGAASGAMLADQSSLGLKNPTPDQFRRNTGDWSGGLIISLIGSTLEQDYGIPVHVYDASDGYTFEDLLIHLKRGRFAVVNGDYGTVPTRLTGSDTFNELHSEFWHQYSPTKGILVGDPLNDGRKLAWSGRVVPKGYVWYPIDVARKYVNSFDRQVPGVGIHACVMDLKRLRARPVSPETNIRESPERGSTVIGKFGGTQTVAWGGVVRGQSIAGNTVWYRVWCPSASKIGYCHSSVVARV
jgi:hypothetical protein